MIYVLLIIEVESAKNVVTEATIVQKQYEKKNR